MTDTRRRTFIVCPCPHPEDTDKSRRAEDRDSEVCGRCKHMIGYHTGAHEACTVAVVVERTEGDR